MRTTDWARHMRKTGDKDLAIANYQKSLDLNPKNDGAVKMLAELRKK